MFEELYKGTGEGRMLEDAGENKDQLRHNDGPSFLDVQSLETKEVAKKVSTTACEGHSRADDWMSECDWLPLQESQN